jgi:hypothetical protein
VSKKVKAFPFFLPSVSRRMAVAGMAMPPFVMAGEVASKMKNTSKKRVKSGRFYCGG